MVVYNHCDKIHTLHLISGQEEKRCVHTNHQDICGLERFDSRDLLRSKFATKTGASEDKSLRGRGWDRWVMD